MKSEKEVFYKNRGVERNKKPLKNIVYKVELLTADKLKSKIIDPENEKYCYKDQGIISLLWKYQSDNHWNYHGWITPEDLKERIGTQWSAFCQGRREFIIQRRLNGNNIKKI